MKTENNDFHRQCRRCSSLPKDELTTHKPPSMSISSSPEWRQPPLLSSSLPRSSSSSSSSSSYSYSSSSLSPLSASPLPLSFSLDSSSSDSNPILETGAGTPLILLLFADDVSRVYCVSLVVLSITIVGNVRVNREGAL